MRVDFHFSKEFEVKRIHKSLQELPWFKENGYDYQSILRLPTFDTSLSIDKIASLVEDDFDESKYLKAKEEIMTFKDIISRYSSDLNNLFALSLNKIGIPEFVIAQSLNMLNVGSVFAEAS